MERRWKRPGRVTARVLATSALAATAIGVAAGSSSADVGDNRNVDVTVVNHTNCTLRLDSTSLDHGVWNNKGQPPQVIGAGGTGTFGSGDLGWLTGTEGRAQYHAEDCHSGTVHNGAVVKLHWDNPYIGSNSYDTGGSDSDFSRSTSGGSGNRTAVAFDISQVSLPLHSGRGPSHGTVAFLEAGNGMFADLDGGRTASGTSVKSQAPNWSQAEEWVFWDKGNGNWQIETQYRGAMVLDYNFSNWTTWLFGAHDGNNQLWRFNDAGGGWYTVTSARDGACLTANLNQAALGVWKCNGSDSQRWHLVNR
ncbi:aegerolysin family protein [Streptomyces melanogenes]|uniref:RICIN domain-containing protein n=1 Tax=Streptomyces melanogenes TaxID=67326 RepID=A0ABZ1XX56_9ACTN|nr:aegerolysin family protein [Streptomyces melanogenes]